MREIEVRSMRPEDWKSVSRIYLEGIATEHATFQTDCFEPLHKRRTAQNCFDNGTVYDTIKFIKQPGRKGRADKRRSKNR